VSDSKERERDGEDEKGQAVYLVHFCINNHWQLAAFYKDLRQKEKIDIKLHTRALRGPESDAIECHASPEHCNTARNNHQNLPESKWFAFSGGNLVR
jgi:hypothetical protein